MGEWESKRDCLTNSERHWKGNRSRKNKGISALAGRADGFFHQQCIKTQTRDILQSIKPDYYYRLKYLQQ